MLIRLNPTLNCFISATLIYSVLISDLAQAQLQTSRGLRQGGTLQNGRTKDLGGMDDFKRDLDRRGTDFGNGGDLRVFVSPKAYWLWLVFYVQHSSGLRNDLAIQFLDYAKTYSQTGVADAEVSQVFDQMFDQGGFPAIFDLWKTEFHIKPGCSAQGQPVAAATDSGLAKDVCLSFERLYELKAGPELIMALVTEEIAHHFGFKDLESKRNERLLNFFSLGKQLDLGETLSYAESQEFPPRPNRSQIFASYLESLEEVFELAAQSGPRDSAEVERLRMTVFNGFSGMEEENWITPGCKAVGRVIYRHFLESRQ